MPVLFRLDPLAHLVFTTFYGVVTMGDLSAYRRVLVADSQFRPEFDELVDASAVSSVAVTPADLREAARTSVFHAGARRAIVAPGDDVHGVARMVEAMYGGEAELAVFRSAPEARAWLRSRSRASSDSAPEA